MTPKELKTSNTKELVIVYKIKIDAFTVKEKLKPFFNELNSILGRN